MTQAEAMRTIVPARLFRERVVLTELRRLGHASKTDIAKGAGFALIIFIKQRLAGCQIIDPAGKGPYFSPVRGL